MPTESRKALARGIANKAIYTESPSHWHEGLLNLFAKEPGTAEHGPKQPKNGSK